MRTMTALAIVAVLVAGCGRGGEAKVEYTITCGEVVCRANHSETTELPFTGSVVYNCYWDCATYEGMKERRVRMTFYGPVGGCWERGRTEVEPAEFCNGCVMREAGVCVEG